MNKTESLPHGLQEKGNVIKCCHGDGARMSREGGERAWRDVRTVWREPVEGKMGWDEPVR